MPNPNYNFLSSVGITVEYGTHVIKGASDFTDIGGKPEGLDATPLSSPVKITKTGIQDMGTWDVTYFYNNEDASDDYRFLQAASSANPKVSQTIKVTFPDGSVHQNSGTVSNYITGTGVNAMIKAVASFALDGDWTHTDPV